jgi:anaerobic selenocysteine-containing dehydrogenase
MMTVPPTLFRRAVLEDIPYPVRAAYMQGTNPLLTYADSRMTLMAMMKLDFLAVADTFMTPTASFADIVLPTATSFEFNDIGHVGLGHGCVLARPKVVDPPEECWPEIKILNELGKRLTPAEYWYRDYSDFIEEILRPTGMRFEQFAEKGYLTGPEQYKKYEKKGFKTPTAKVELCLSKADELDLPRFPSFTALPEDDDTDYPLILTSRKSRFYLHSSYRWIERLRSHSPLPATDIHPETAARYGILEGDEVIIKTRTGEIRQYAHLTDKIHPRVIYCAFGWWFPEADPGTQYDWERSNFNILTSTEKIGREFGTPNVKGINCNIEKR